MIIFSQWSKQLQSSDRKALVTIFSQEYSAQAQTCDNSLTTGTLADAGLVLEPGLG